MLVPSLTGYPLIAIILLTGGAFSVDYGSPITAMVGLALITLGRLDAAAFSESPSVPLRVYMGCRLVPCDIRRCDACPERGRRTSSH